MKTVSDEFRANRLRVQPPPTKIRVTLSEHQLTGTLIDETDITDKLLGGIPEIKKEIEDKLNSYRSSMMTLSFEDQDKAIGDILDGVGKKFLIKVDVGFDDPDITQADVIATGDEPEAVAFSPDGDFLFVGCIGVSDKLQKFTVASNGTLTESASVNTSEAFYDIVVTDNYIYAGKAGRFKIYDYDLVEIGSVVPPTSTGNHRIFVSSNENHAWSVDPWQNKVYYFNISDKTAPTSVLAVSSIDGYSVVYFDNKIYVIDRDEGTDPKLKVYDASTPSSVPYSLLATLDLTDTDPQEMILDNERAILYITGHNTYTSVIDISDTDSPVEITVDNTAAVVGKFAVRNGLWLFLHDSTDDKIYVVDTINHYCLEAYSSLALTATTNIGLAHDGDNLLAWVDRGEDKLYTMNIYRDWVNVFDGLVEYQSKIRAGRNIVTFTSHSMIKEFEEKNAELIYDEDNDPFRTIGGVTPVSIQGGTIGAKILKYEYATRKKGTEIEEVRKLQYDSGVPAIFVQSGRYTLVDKSGLQKLTVDVVVGDLPTYNTEDTLVIGDTSDISKIGYWWEFVSISTIIGKLWDSSFYTISDRTINIAEIKATGQERQFRFLKAYKQTAGIKKSCICQIGTGLDDFIVAIGTKVYKVTYTESTLTITIQEPALLDITTYHADATYVEKIIDIGSSEYLLVIAKEWDVDLGGSYEDQTIYMCLGVIKIDSNGNVLEDWDVSELTPSGQSVLTFFARSFQLSGDTGAGNQRLSYLAYTWNGNGNNGSALYWDWIQVQGSKVAAACNVTLDDTGTLEKRKYGQACIFYWYIMGGAGGGVTAEECHFVRMAGSLSQYVKCWYDGSWDWYITGQVNLDSLKDDILFSATRGSEPNRYGYLVGNINEDGKQIILCSNRGQISGDNQALVDYNITHPVGYSDEKMYAWSLYSEGIESGICELTYVSLHVPPTKTELIGGFIGTEYNCSSFPEREGSKFFGLAERGNTHTRVFFDTTDESIGYLHRAAFSGMTVKQALDSLAEAFLCIHDRSERGKALFISRENFVGTFTLDHDLYFSGYEIGKNPIYLGVEVVNDFYPGMSFLYRHPDDFNAEEGLILLINNRFVFPINGKAIAKIYYDWFNTNRRNIPIPGFLLLELEGWDKVNFKIYDIDGNVTETVATVALETSYDPRTKITKLRVVELGAEVFKKTLYIPYDGHFFE